MDSIAKKLILKGMSGGVSFSIFQTIMMKHFGQDGQALVDSLIGAIELFDGNESRGKRLRNALLTTIIKLNLLLEEGIIDRDGMKETQSIFIESFQECSKYCLREESSAEGMEKIKDLFSKLKHSLFDYIEGKAGEELKSHIELLLGSLGDEAFLNFLLTDSSCIVFKKGIGIGLGVLLCKATLANVGNDNKTISLDDHKQNVIDQMHERKERPTVDEFLQDPSLSAVFVDFLAERRAVHHFKFLREVEEYRGASSKAARIESIRKIEQSYFSEKGRSKLDPDVFTKETLLELRNQFQSYKECKGPKPKASLFDCAQIQVKLFLQNEIDFYFFSSMTYRDTS